MKIEATSFEEAYKNATNHFGCSITCLDIQTIQAPSKGLFGFFKKNAIIDVELKNSSESKKDNNINRQKSEIKKEVKKDDASKNKKKNKKESKAQICETPVKVEPKLPRVRKDKKIVKNAKMPECLDEIRVDLEKLFKASCFEIDKFEVSAFDDETVYILLDGADAALLIGKEGYRYKAISYLLFNWINTKYSLGIRLEIAEFLKNQEEMIKSYLETVIARVEANGKAQTKPLDGVLVKIALEQLRVRFPEKYVGIKSNGDGRFVVVNDFYKKS